MAKRKKKDPTAELLVAFLTLVICIAFYTTQSFSSTAVIGIGVATLILLIQYILRINKEEKIRNSGILQVDKMTGVQFEEYLRLLYSNAGYKVKTTPTSGDFGADLLLEKGDRRIAVQAKRYKANVGIKAVQEIVSAKIHYKADEAWVVTNSHYTKAAEKLAESNRVKLIGRDQLISYSLEINKALKSRSEKALKPAK